MRIRCSVTGVVLGVVLGLTATATGWAQGLPTASPSDVGLSSERLDRLEAVVQRYIDDDLIAGAVTLIARRGRQAHLEAFGMADRNDGVPMTPDTIFRIASMTKPVTSVAVMMLYEEGHFKLNDPIGQYLPPLASLEVLTPGDEAGVFDRVAASRPVTIRHLLTHTSGIGYRFLGSLAPSPAQRTLSELYAAAGVADGLAEHDGTVEGLVAALGGLPLMHEPGAAFTYGLSDDVLGRLVEVVSGVTFDEFLRTRLFEPLRMLDTSFYLPGDKAGRLASIYTPAEAGGGLEEVEGTVDRGHLIYSSTYSTGEYRSNFSGGAGLASTARDYSRFLQMLLNGGELDGVRILSPLTVDLMATDHIGDIPLGSVVAPGTGGFGLGLAITGNPGVDGEIGSEGAYYWSGFFGTRFWVDPKEDLIGILMIQVFPNTSDIQERFRIMAYQAIVDP